MQIKKIKRRKICEIILTFACLIATDLSVVQADDKFSCDFEDPTTCRWTQDSSDHFKWTRNQGYTAPKKLAPTTDHTKGVGFLPNKDQGPGSIQHRRGKCIHVLRGRNTRPREGEPLVVSAGCGINRLEFKLYPNGTLMHTRNSMCVKPIGANVNDGTKVGVYSNCNATDKWSWTAKRSLKYKNQYCLKPRVSNPTDGTNLVLDSNCDRLRHYFEFVPSHGWYLYIKKSSPRYPNDTARFISPSTTQPKSCLHFFYYMYGHGIGKLQVYVKSEGNMGLPVWVRYGNHGKKWNEAQVVVNNQKAPYQFVIEGVLDNFDYGDIAIDDINLKDSCSYQGNISCSSTVSTLPTTEVKERTRESSSRTIIIIATTVGAGELLIIVLLLVKLKRQQQRSKLLTPVDIRLTAVETSPEILPINQEPSCATVAGIDRDLTITSTSAEGYVIPAHERQEPVYEDIKPRSNLPGYTELDQMKREIEESQHPVYQKMV